MRAQVVQLLSHEHWRVRRGAVMAMETADDELLTECGDLLERLLWDLAPEVRAQATSLMCAREVLRKPYWAAIVRSLHVSLPSYSVFYNQLIYIHFILF